MTAPLHPSWVKSTYSGNEVGSNCLEWAPEAAVAGAVPVRDSKNPDGPVLRVSSPVWTRFVDSVREGESSVR
ncbi:DUF397 domain-containing protein [Streptomyces sp. NPDC090442]|uniref:DUF397 domain-containing protein n=1 Tax=Streptomyces sp. NPDC090442 TaxID=3365962 RepID=UPI003827C2D1